ncbi:hypothetical protein Mame01_45080 [Microbispora amethystogenes]|nr:hypothetical protein Mame01_45080 [Microbispora amethystogenes]
MVAQQPRAQRRAVSHDQLVQFGSGHHRRLVPRPGVATGPGLARWAGDVGTGGSATLYRADPAGRAEDPSAVAMDSQIDATLALASAIETPSLRSRHHPRCRRVPQVAIHL